MPWVDHADVAERASEAARILIETFNSAHQVRVSLQNERDKFMSNFDQVHETFLYGTDKIIAGLEASIKSAADEDQISELRTAIQTGHEQRAAGERRYAEKRANHVKRFEKIEADIVADLNTLTTKVCLWVETGDHSGMINAPCPTIH